jgi:hypothetical protein
MTIPEAQLETWSHQGSITQSRRTYATVKTVLEDPNATYACRKSKVFLQGSYCNDTNIYAESDVDIVIVYQGAFFKDLSELPEEQVTAYNSHYSPNTYPYDDFKKEVKAHLEKAFGKSVKPSEKAFKIAADGSRRSSDVIPAFRYRRYFRFMSVFDERYEKGICFKSLDKTLLANYPEQHAKNCITKQAATNDNFKPLVRIFKNMRSKLEDDGVIEQGIAPSYFVEGLLYNAPPENFVGSYQDMVLNVLKWLHATADKSNFVCANEQYYLLRDDDPVCWPIANGNEFINAVIELWNDWT